MKTAIWLYFFMFIALFDLHAQFPILSPFALSLGAAPSFIGLIMGVYSLTHLPGNLLAGYGVDRFGSKRFISVSLMGGGILLFLQSKVTDPWQLLAIRSMSGFVLAFLSPASMAMLAKLAKNKVHQSQLMSGNGIVHTLASVVSPAAGALLVSQIGFSRSFVILGWILFVTGLFTLVGLKETKALNPSATSRAHAKPNQAAALTNIPDSSSSSLSLFFFGIPIGLSCAQGILFFELPLGSVGQHSLMSSGMLFSMISIGALFSLSLVFLNRVSTYRRALSGSLFLALLYFGMSIAWSMPLYVTLFLIGAANGIIFPAMAALLAEVTPHGKYGRAFSFLAISSSCGSFLGPVLAGQLRTDISPFFLAFLALMFGLILMPFSKPQNPVVIQP
ncbi:MAG: MFS transporter [Gorillibacterium sp.]|nr:MFS transporter [Gorillibacterium sp.]